MASLYEDSYAEIATIWAENPTVDKAASEAKISNTFGVQSFVPFELSFTAPPGVISPAASAPCNLVPNRKRSCETIQNVVITKMARGINHLNYPKQFTEDMKERAVALAPPLSAIAAVAVTGAVDKNAAGELIDYLPPPRRKRLIRYRDHRGRICRPPVRKPCI
ncbi:MAG: hypothetical protein Hyperionvirus4_14 [Hyperionvirus sp.]|uniref:Uncharacterized protein n=1 Tax=Hyperionvirus sp. TaxID=2487770 RepID=A0A3G5ACI1_9VIRU|nr:MAG: hypothetical protein Hyperionvirus4_14 [Hyperionvirus sp.]